MNNKYILHTGTNSVELSADDVRCSEDEMNKRRKYIKDNPDK